MRVLLSGRERVHLISFNTNWKGKCNVHKGIFCLHNSTQTSMPLGRQMVRATNIRKSPEGLEILRNKCKVINNTDSEPKILFVPTTLLDTERFKLVSLYRASLSFVILDLVPNFNVGIAKHVLEKCYKVVLTNNVAPPPLPQVVQH